MPERSITLLRATVWEYYRAHGRHDLPWRRDISPYSIFVSEVMLQQTQVPRVIPKYQLFLKALPDFEALATVSTPRILQLWQGLGYNRRALWLRQAAQRTVSDFGGKLPSEPDKLQQLPGIGLHTAGSIAAFAFNLPTVFVETNIRKAILHHCFPDQTKVDQKDIIVKVAELVDQKRPREWYWAMMDYGSWLATRHKGLNTKVVQYRSQSRFEGSLRQIRGEVIRLALSDKKIDFATVQQRFPGRQDEIREALQSLVKEGFLAAQNKQFIIKP